MRISRNARKLAIVLSSTLSLTQYLPALAEIMGTPTGGTNGADAATSPGSTLANTGTNTKSAVLVDSKSALDGLISGAQNLQIDNSKNLAIDFGKLGTDGLAVSGLLSNYGTIFAFSTNPTVNTANFYAGNLTNYGLITSILPTDGFASLNLNAASFIPNLNLSFNVVNNFQNLGQITSAANVAIAANTVVNTGTISAYKISTSVRSQAPSIRD